MADGRVVCFLPQVALEYALLAFNVWKKEGEFQGQDVGKGGHLRPKLALYALGTTPVD